MTPYSKPNLSIWIVSGVPVRLMMSQDFLTCGYDLINHYIPKGQIWIEDSVKPEDILNTLIYCLWERDLLLQGCPFDKAHDRALSAKRHFKRYHYAMVNQIKDLIRIQTSVSLAARYVEHPLFSVR